MARCKRIMRIAGLSRKIGVSIWNSIRGSGALGWLGSCYSSRLQAFGKVSWAKSSASSAFPTSLNRSRYRASRWRQISSPKASGPPSMALAAHESSEFIAMRPFSADLFARPRDEPGFGGLAWSYVFGRMTTRCSVSPPRSVVPNSWAVSSTPRALFRSASFRVTNL